MPHTAATRTAIREMDAGRTSATLIDEVLPEQPSSAGAQLPFSTAFSVRQPAGDHGADAWHCLSRDRHPSDQEGGRDGKE